jgi:hypothetical protein
MAVDDKPRLARTPKAVNQFRPQTAFRRVDKVEKVEKVDKDNVALGIMGD